MRGVLVTALAVLALASTLAGAGTRQDPSRWIQAQHVTLIGDSVADALALDSEARAVLGRGIDLDLEATPCRRVEGEGCPYQGLRPPSAVDVIRSLGPHIGRNVVIAVGYNDFEFAYAGNIADALAALADAGVQHVWWLTLRAVRHPYLTMNDDIQAAARSHPELEVVDWNAYSRSHPDWFQDDGIHLSHAGAVAMATLVHGALADAGVAPGQLRVATASLPRARRGRPYRVRLRASGGLAPFRWTLLERAPAGIHLEATGLVAGTPRARPGRYTFDVRVRDSAGSTATRRLSLRIGS